MREYTEAMLGRYLQTSKREGQDFRRVHQSDRLPPQGSNSFTPSSKSALAKRQKLAATYHGLNPITLLKQINENLERLWTTAEYPTHQQKKVKTYQASVAVYFDATR